MPDAPRARRARLEPRDPRFEKRVRESFAEQGWMQTLGARLVEVAPGHVSIELTPRPELSQQNGYLHAGVLTSIADSACGYAARTLMPAGSNVLSVEFKVNLLAPATGSVVRADARVVRSGRTLTVCEADVFAGSGGEGGEAERHVAIMMATMIRIAPPGGDSGDG